MGVPFFVPGWHGSFGPAGPCGGAYAIRPYMGTRHSCTRQTWLASADARMQYAPTGTRPNLAGIPDALSALLSDSIFAAVFGDAKSDGPVRDVKRESSERLEQCPLL